MSDNQLRNNIGQLIEALEKSEPARVKAVIGVDGFVDEILHVVDTRKNAEEYTRIKTLKDYGERIVKAAGLSTNVEMVPVQVKLGGNGPIMSNALVSYGVDVTYIGALGDPDIHPVFKPMAEKATVYSIANPSNTDAVEFDDGKLIVSKLEAFKAVNWENIKKKIGVEKLASIINQATLFGLENWTMVPYMSDIWKNFIKEVFPLLKNEGEKNYIFFDLADPEKRTKEDILEALDLIRQFRAHFKVILGLNRKEAFEIAKTLDLSCVCNGGYNDFDLRETTISIAEKLGLYCLVVHPVSEAAAFSNGEYCRTPGPYTPKPKLTTGAGDNFNAGFCLGQTLGLPIQLSLILGTATSGFYVRNAKSPSLTDVIGFLKNWRAEA